MAAQPARQPRGGGAGRRERQKAIARIVDSSDPDFARLWQIVNENNHDRYNGYQRRTSRPIPVVVVSPS